MPNEKNIPESKDLRTGHLRITEPSEWLVRFARLIPENGLVLDLAAGGGRHSRHLLSLGYRVVAIDQVADPLEWLTAESNSECVISDLETNPAPFQAGGVLFGRKFDAIIVINYLHRPLMRDLIEALNPGGVLIYETFALGNEKFTRPRNPDHLLKNEELLQLVQNHLSIVAYESGLIQRGPLPGVKQRICAVKNLTSDPQPYPLFPE